MTSSDEGEDRELLARYRQASDADPRTPSAAVRAAILEEGRRVAASLSSSAAIEPERPQRSRWKMTAWGTAAAVLLAGLVIAPRLWNETPPMRRVAAGAPPVPFNQAASKSEPVEPAAEPRPVVPVMPVPAPSPESIPPRVLADAPTLRRAVPPPPPVHIPEQSVEITPLDRDARDAAATAAQPRLNSLAQARAMNPRYAASGEFAKQSASASAPPLSAAAAAGDLVKTTQLLDQGAAINYHDEDGRTPLMLAIAQNQIDTVRLLLGRGADPNASDNEGLSPLQLARQNKFDDIVALLIKAGAR
jgi:hypothetical protein